MVNKMSTDNAKLQHDEFLTFLCKQQYQKCFSFNREEHRVAE